MVGSRAEQEKYQMKIKQLVLPESMQVLKTNNWKMQKGDRSKFEGIFNDQIWGNLINTINNNNGL